MTEFISKTEFAKRMGVNPSTVHAACDRGRLTLLPNKDQKNRLMLPWPDAKTEWERLHGASQPTVDVNADGSAPTNETWAEAKTRKDKAAADLLELQLRTKKGELLERTLVERQAFEAARRVRDAILNVPNRIADQLAVETDRFKVHQLMVAELNKALEELAATNWEQATQEVTQEIASHDEESENE